MMPQVWKKAAAPAQGRRAGGGLFVRVDLAVGQASVIIDGGVDEIEAGGAAAVGAGGAAGASASTGATDGVGYVLKDRVSDLAEFAAAVRQVGSGGSPFHPLVIDQLPLVGETGDGRRGAAAAGPRAARTIAASCSCPTAVSMSCSPWPASVSA